MRGLHEECAAQATVEMAVVAPVLVVLALIVYNVMLFASAVACFDRVAPDAVIAQGVSPEGEGGALGVAGSCDEISKQIENALEGYDIEIDVVSQGGGNDAAAQLSFVGVSRTYRCVMRYRPWPTGFSVAGVNLGAPLYLEHVREVTVDPWRPGVIV